MVGSRPRGSGGFPASDLAVADFQVPEPELRRGASEASASDFLGYHIRRMHKRGTSKYYVYTKPSRKAIQAIKDKAKAKTYRSTRHTVPGRVGELLPVRSLQGNVQRDRPLHLAGLPQMMGTR